MPGARTGTWYSACWRFCSPDGRSLPLGFLCVRAGIHAVNGAHNVPDAGEWREQGIQPTDCSAFAAPVLALSKTVYIRFSACLMPKTSNAFITAVHVCSVAIWAAAHTIGLREKYRNTQSAILFPLIFCRSSLKLIGVPISFAPSILLFHK